MQVQRWTGRILLLPGAAIYVGPIGCTRAHRHHAVQLLVAPEGIAIAAPERLEARALVLPADYPHALLSSCERGAVVLLDRESHHARRLPCSPLVSPVVIGDAEADGLVALLSHPLDASWLEGLLARWSPVSLAPEHPGVRRARRMLETRSSSGPVPLAVLAETAGLSEGRLGHVFREQVGLPIRAFARWCRLQAAARHLGAGRSITTAAHEAGFADAAHLSRTFRTTLGLAPSDLVGHVEWIGPSSEQGGARLAQGAL
jgi:AraC-like DNA-binding protein